MLATSSFLYLLGINKIERWFRDAMPSFGIVLPVRNRKSFTLAILRQLSEQITQQVSAGNLQSQDIQIVVVDDDSSDGTPEHIESQFPTVHLLRGSGDLWWTGAIAQGMTYLRNSLSTDYIIWLNDDIVLADDFIYQILQRCKNPTEKLITGGIITDQQHPHWIVFGGVVASQLINDTKQFEAPIIDVDTLNGNIAIFPTLIIDDIGLPDMRRFRHYGGDFEYICRAKSSGYKAELSKDISATTDYRLEDITRYAPLWIQWAISRGLASRLNVLSSLTSRRSPHNVEHMVNSIYRAQPSVPRWRYAAFYARKMAKIVSSEFVPKHIRRKHIQDYLHLLNTPSDLAQSVLEKL